MITQTFKQGTHEIKIEIAESIDDAKKNNFSEGIYNRFFIDNKPVLNYVSMVRFIVDEIKNNKSSIVPSNLDLLKKRNELLQKNNDVLKNEMLKIKGKINNIVCSDEMQKNIDDIINKINPIGMRISE